MTVSSISLGSASAGAAGGAATGAAACADAIGSAAIAADAIAEVTEPLPAAAAACDGTIGCNPSNRLISSTSTSALPAVA